MIILLIFSILLAGVAEAVADKVNFHYEKSIFKDFKNRQWWDNSISWENKYRGSNVVSKYLWKTILVVFTDAWHLFKALHSFGLFLMVISSYLLSINIYWYIGLLLGGYLLKKLIFEIFFSKLLNKD